MNVFGERARSWRKARKRGVSPIIATILLVAITVVLAAVLYVLISGLTHGPSSAPLGTNFSWGVPINATSAGPSTTGCGATGAATQFCYSIEIAGSSVSTSNVVLALRNSAGATVAWPAGGTTTTTSGVSVPTANQIVLISPTVTTPVAAYNSATSGWTLATGFTGSITGGFSIVIWLHGGTTATGYGMLGDEIVAIGASGYSGSVPSNAFS